MKTLFTILGALVIASTFAQTKSSIEAAEYDPVNNRFFVSNGNSILVTSDGGDSWDFFSDGDATHGMEVLGNSLFVVDGDFIRAFDLTTEEELGSLEIMGASFLNGMANNGTDKLWVSDFGNGEIHEIDVTDPSNMTNTEVADIPQTPNGLTYDNLNNRVIIVTWGSNAGIYAMDDTSYAISTLVGNTGLGNLDGVDNDVSGNFYVSSWSPSRITRYNNDFSTSETVVSSGLSSPADISYAQGTDSLAVANSSSAQVTFHYFGVVDNVNEIAEEVETLKVYPTPASNFLWMEYELTSSSVLEVKITNLSGQVVANQSLGQKSAGALKEKIDLSQLASGNYILQLHINGELVKSTPAIVK